MCYRKPAYVRERIFRGERRNIPKQFSGAGTKRIIECVLIDHRSEKWQASLDRETIPDEEVSINAVILCFRKCLVEGWEHP